MLAGVSPLSGFVELSSFLSFAFLEAARLIFQQEEQYLSFTIFSTPPLVLMARNDTNNALHSTQFAFVPSLAVCVSAVLLGVNPLLAKSPWNIALEATFSRSMTAKNPSENELLQKKTKSLYHSHRQIQ